MRATFTFIYASALKSDEKKPQRATDRADVEKHAAELARAHEAAERLRVELEALRKASAAKLD